MSRVSASEIGQLQRIAKAYEAEARGDWQAVQADEADLLSELSDLGNAAESISDYDDARQGELWSRWLSHRRAALNRDLALVRARREIAAAEYARAKARADVLAEMLTKAEWDARRKADRHADEDRLRRVLTLQLMKDGQGGAV